MCVITHAHMTPGILCVNHFPTHTPADTPSAPTIIDLGGFRTGTVHQTPRASSTSNCIPVRATPVALTPAVMQSRCLYYKVLSHRSGLHHAKGMTICACGIGHPRIALMCLQWVSAAEEVPRVEGGRRARA